MKIINLSGTVGFEINAVDFKNQLPKNEDVLIKVNSPGGFVFEAFEIFNLIKDFKKETGNKVNVLINGLAASAASYFIMAADKITVRENSVFMAHKAWSFAMGNSDDLSKESEILSGIDSVLASAYSKKTGKPKEEILDSMKDEIWLFGSDIKNSLYADDEEPITETADEIEAFTPAEAKAKVYQAKKQIENFYALKEKEKKAAAQITDAQIKNRIDIENNNFSCQNKKNNEEVSMNFEEFLKQNPNAMAEVETSSHFKNAIASATKKENDRVNKLLTVAGVQISDTLKHAIENNLNSGDFAEAELIAQNEKRKNDSGVETLGKLMTSNQLPKDSAEPKKVNGAVGNEDEIKALAAKFGKGEV